MTVEQEIDLVLIKYTDGIEGCIHEEDFDDLHADILKLIKEQAEVLADHKLQ